MFHHNTETVLEIWRRRRGAQLLPARSSLPDAAMTSLLPQTLILGETGSDLVVRLCGGRLADMFAGDLTDRPFTHLFSVRDGPALMHHVRTARRAAAPFVIRARECGGHRDAVLVEIFLGPLAGGPDSPKRWLGHVQNLNPHAEGPCMGALEVEGFALAAERRPGPTLRLVSVNGALVA